MRPVPERVVRWIGRRRWLRWGDGLVAWALLWGAAIAGLGPGQIEAAAVLGLALVAAGIALPPLRVRWRPITGWVGLRISQDLRVGDRAWYLGAREASLVVVTARRGVRLVIARPDLAQDEGFSVRRTRVLLLALEPGGNSR
jgi:hypothetical protein